MSDSSGIDDQKSSKFIFFEKRENGMMDLNVAVNLMKHLSPYVLCMSSYKNYQNLHMELTHH